MMSVEQSRRYEKEQTHRKEEGCKYPLCVNYKPTAQIYCCNACAGDHHDYDRLNGGKMNG